MVGRVYDIRYTTELLRLSRANAVSRWKTALARASRNLENSSVSLRWHFGTSEQWKVYFCSPGRTIFRQRDLYTLHILYWCARQHNLYCWQISALLGMDKEVRKDVFKNTGIYQHIKNCFAALQQPAKSADEGLIKSELNNLKLFPAMGCHGIAGYFVSFLKETHRMNYLEEYLASTQQGHVGNSVSWEWAT